MTHLWSNNGMHTWNLDAVLWQGTMPSYTSTALVLFLTKSLS